MAETKFRNETVLGDWRLGRQIGSGGQGEVWEVRPAAKKVPTPPRAMKICVAKDELGRQRFRQEVEILRGLKHPGIMAVYDASLEWKEEPKTKLECAFYVMERCDTSLESLTWLSAVPFYAVQLFKEICEAVAHLHSLSPPVLHRDIKPQNVLVGVEPRRLVLTDFGIAKVPQDGPGLTQTHEVVGTAFYRAPEAHNGATYATEVYSLGRTLEFMLTGKHPTGLQPMPLPASAHLSETAREALYKFLRKASAPMPEERFKDVAELLAELPELMVVTRAEMTKPAFSSVTSVPATASLAPDGGSQQRTAAFWYEHTKEILRRNDKMAWREVSKTRRTEMHKSLFAWRQDHGNRHLGTFDDLMRMTDGALSAIERQIAEMVAVSEFPQDGFGDGKFIIGDLLNISDWQRGSSPNEVLKVPNALVYACTNLLGALALSTERPAACLPICSHPVPDQASSSGEVPVWRAPDFYNQPVSLGGDSSVAWRYVFTLPERHSWLLEVFGALREYQISLMGYWWVLAFVELADSLTRTERATNDDWYRLPLGFLLEKEEIVQAGYRQAFPSAQALEALATGAKCSTKAIYEKWDQRLLELKDAAPGFGPSARIPITPRLNLPPLPR
ncbi:MAG: serine/threonine-protein kinase [Polyangiaceae bacterium]